MNTIFVLSLVYKLNYICRHFSLLTHFTLLPEQSVPTLAPDFPTILHSLLPHPIPVLVHAQEHSLSLCSGSPISHQKVHSPIVVLTLIVVCLQNQLELSQYVFVK